MHDTVELTRDEMRLIMLALYKLDELNVDTNDAETSGELHDQLASLGFSRFEGHREGLKVTLEVREDG